MVRHLTSAAAVALLLTLAGCAGSTDRPRHHTATPRRAPELVFFHRVAWTADPWVDELDVRTDGTALLRLPRGGAGGFCHVARLDRRSLAGLQAAVRQTSFRADRDRSGPTPGGYAYLVRRGDRSVSASGGHVPARLRPLIGRLDRLTDRLMASASPGSRMGCSAS